MRNLKRALDKQKTLNSVNFISHIAEKKEHLSSKNNLIREMITTFGVMYQKRKKPKSKI